MVGRNRGSALVRSGSAAGVKSVLLQHRRAKLLGRPAPPSAAAPGGGPGGGGGVGGDENKPSSSPLAVAPSALPVSAANKAGGGGGGGGGDSDVEGPSTDLRIIYGRLLSLAAPYWKEVPEARWKLAGVVALTLATTGVSVLFNVLGRDFFTALSERDVDAFQTQLVRCLPTSFFMGVGDAACGLAVVVIPAFAVG